MNTSTKWRRRYVAAFAAIAGVAVFCIYYIRANPLVFNESFFQHAHCIKMASGFLEQYALENDGRFPYHPNGYGDAILLISNVWLGCFNGPGYDTRAWEEARRRGTDVPEDQCGRVYVQGLSVTNDPALALLFDKISSPGDHLHFFRRIRAPFVREVMMIGGFTTISDADWPGFAHDQIELLVAAGIERRVAEAYYSVTLN